MTRPVARQLLAGMLGGAALAATVAVSLAVFGYDVHDAALRPSGTLRGRPDSLHAAVSQPTWPAGAAIVPPRYAYAADVALSV